MTIFSKKSDLLMTIDMVWITTLSVLQMERTMNLEVKNTFSLIYAMDVIIIWGLCAYHMTKIDKGTFPLSKLQ